MTISFVSARDFFDFAAFVNTDFNVNDLEGLLDAELVELAANVGAAYKMGAFVKNTELSKNVDLYDEYSTELASASLWTGTTAAGAVLVPTSVAVDATLKGWTVTFASVVASINLQTPAILDAAGVVGIEGIRLAGV